MKCDTCHVERETKSDRTPMGWKRLGDALHCDKCWRGKYALRAVTIPIACPVGMGWPELRKLLRESFEMATQASNWALRQLAMSDPGIDLGTKKLGKMQVCEPGGKSLYKGVADHFDLDTRTASCLTQLVQAKYRALRLDMQRGKVSLPSLRYPQPIPMHNATWSIAEGEDGGLVLDMPLGRKNRVQVKLRGGQNYRRQLVAVRQLIRGEAIQGQLDVMEQGTKVLCKMVGWFPKTERRDGWAAALHTGGDAFLALYNDERRAIYRWNADHIRRWIVAQDEQMQRLREDLKAEKRMGRDRDGILARMSDLRQKHHDRMHSFCHEVSSQVIGHLSRRRCGLLMVVDADKSYLPHFPWHKLRTMLADKANRAGIEIASGDAASETPEPLELETQQ